MALKSCTKRSVFVYARTQRFPLFMGFGMEVRKRDVGEGWGIGVVTGHPARGVFSSKGDPPLKCKKVPPSFEL